MSDWVIDVVESLGYIGIALLTLLENVFPPIPSELIMPLAGFQSTQGGMSFWGAVIAGSAGSLGGTLAWYWAGRFIGEESLRRWIERHGIFAVFFCRMIPGLRTLISLPAGFNRMSMAAFLPASTLGTLLWTLGLTYVGHLLGANHQAVKSYVGIVSWVVMGSIAAMYAWRQYKHFSGQPSSHSAD